MTGIGTAYVTNRCNETTPLGADGEVLLVKKRGIRFMALVNTSDAEILIAVKLS